MSDKYVSFQDSYCNSKEYRAEHCFCPKCGCVSHTTTLACCYGDKDTNRACCQNCGWRGIVHDMVAIRVENACQCVFCKRMEKS